MSPNTPRPGHLFFTPRTPWGTRAGQQSFRQHQRASEDRKPDPASREMQGLGGQMAPNAPDVRNGGNAVDRQGVPGRLTGQTAAEQAQAPEKLSGQLAPPTQKPLVSQQDLANERWHQDLQDKMAAGRAYGTEGTRGMTYSELNRYNSAFPASEKERADGQVGEHVAVGVDSSKTFGLGEPAEHNAGIIVRTNTSQPFQPLETKEQNDDHWEKMYGPRAPGIKEFNDFYRKKK